MLTTYMLAIANDANSLQQKVQQGLSQGFQPIGGVAVAVAVTPQGTGEVWAQAMAK